MLFVYSDTEKVRDSLYQTETQAFPWELEILKSKTLRRLKHLTHYGASSLITPVTHTRYEHTIGVWTVISTFFKEDKDLRIAALLHDIGHLPFSHAVEKTLGFNHHHLTEERILSEEIASILQKYGFSPYRIIELLNEDTPLSHKTPYLSADHLDSFVRDSFMLGKYQEQPSNLLKRITFNDKYVETDEETAFIILKAIYADHLSFLNPINLGIDALLAKTIEIYVEHKEVDRTVIQSLTNNELIQLLLNSNIKEVENLMSVILWNPECITVHDHMIEGAFEVEVKKVYDKTPLVNGVPLTTINEKASSILEEIRSLQKSYYISIGN
ncbi:HD domain-containing protein [Cytobacillus sp. FJAT-54145]|uniref:HD domain-containing protein n=1 Tax=Cytobacillus spartinae TaxID=3299023 RepID=A0ABW6KEQ3_9BACI